MLSTTILNQIQALPIWKGELSVKPLSGGITNQNFLVVDSEKKCVVRFGDDILEHHVVRSNELAAGRAAHAAGLSPAVLHAENSITVLEYIESRTLTSEDVRDPVMLPRIIEIVKRFHKEVPKHLHGPAQIFWVFHIIRDYSFTLQRIGSAHGTLASELVRFGDKLEQSAGPYDIVFGHNDLLCGNFLDDGNRVWLIDFDYAGFNSPLFDLGGLASNNDLDEMQEIQMLETYFEQPVTDELLHRYAAMKCSSLLRETMWSMVSESASKIDFDYAAYTAENLERFYAAYDDFTQT